MLLKGSMFVCSKAEVGDAPEKEGTFTSLDAG